MVINARSLTVIGCMQFTGNVVKFVNHCFIIHLCKILFCR
nr:MAG TPA: hypothetical protein [Caudoviricetes sp.]